MAEKYPLPTGEGSLGHLFEGLCQNHLDITVASIRDHLRSTVDRVAELNDPALYKNLRDATWVAKRCHVMLDSLEKLAPPDKTLAVGAIRYFVVHVDSVSDLTPGIGFEDDRLIMSHVLERIGWTELLSSP